jgi:hypothetical protein
MGHRRHGYLAAAGVGTSMIAGFALALLVVSAVIGFRGWPTSSVTPPSSISVLPAAGMSAARAPAVHAVAAVGRVIRPAARAPEQRVAHASARRRPAVAPSRPSTGVLPSRPAVVPTSKTPAPVAPAAVTPTSAAPRNGDGVRRTTQDTGAVVQQTAQQAAQAVTPVAPVAGGAVQATGQVAGDAITSTGQALGGVLDTLSPKLP